MATSWIEVHGAREHNLKGIDVRIPRNQLTVITGLSGSGKSSLAFDTVYAEGQRRYIECLSSYARQFLQRLKKPEADLITGLSPAISIEQKQAGFNPRSTVATVTEISDFLRLLFAKVGKITCYQCSRELGSQDIDLILKQIFRLEKETVITISAPLIKERKGEFEKLFIDLRKQGFSRVLVDGSVKDLTDVTKLHKQKRHDIEVIIDYVQASEKNGIQIKDDVQTALRLSGGLCMIRYGESEVLFSEKLSCPDCEISIPAVTPNLFSFNSPHGACSVCRGLGSEWLVAESRIILHPSKSILKGALSPDIFFAFNKYVIEDLWMELSEAYGFEVKAAFQDIPAEAREAFLWGDEKHSGLVHELRELYQTSSSDEVKRKVKKFLEERICTGCQGGRLKKETQGILIAEKSMMDVSAMGVEDFVSFLAKVQFKGSLATVATPILKELRERAGFLDQVGLGYLTLERAANTLAGGELQRIRLARQISVGLTGVLYVLDEPSIGLHSRDNDRLLKTLRRLCGMQNTVIVVEHDEETIRQADYVIDLGPEAGVNGGTLMAQGSIDQILKNPASLTAQYLNGTTRIEIPTERKKPSKGQTLFISGAKEHNLKNIKVKIPAGLFVGVSGVSGSGKSTLVHDVLYRAMQNHLWKSGYKVGAHRNIKGIDLFDKVIQITQTPIGRTPRSNPATYTDMFSAIRNLFSQVPESRMRNYGPGRFSFNVKGGRCEACRGEGTERLSMSFLADAYVDCDACGGKRYNPDTLSVQYKGKNIAEILDLSVDEAFELFAPVPTIAEKLDILKQVGLGYLKLGQPSTTLSGGEAQRIKLASELGKRSSGKTFYILDEPTTGLHFADIANLLKALFALRDAGNTVLVIEHNMDVLKCVDYLIDLGPEGGSQGGELIVEGTPEEVANHSKSITGKYLKEVLKRGRTNSTQMKAKKKKLAKFN